MSSKGDDDKSYKLFTEAAWDGSRTPGFRKFKRDLHAGADAFFLNEDDYSILSAWLDLDQGGQGQGADAMPGQNQVGHANAVRRRISSDVGHPTRRMPLVVAQVTCVT